MGNLFFFDGIGTDELLLCRAEAAARLGNLERAIADMDYLCGHRYEEGGYVPFGDIPEEELLDRILEERRKELVFRGLRWEDLRRFAGTRFEKTVSRELDGTVYELPPGDPRYAFPIPLDEIQLNGLEQNPR